jgi:hypothetical protein
MSLDIPFHRTFPITVLSGTRGEEWSPCPITCGADSVTEVFLKRTIPVGFAIFWIAALVFFIGPG